MRRIKTEIERPPLCETFELPTKEELLKLKKGDTIKLMFSEKGTNVECLWVKITECDSIFEWEGKLDNIPFGLKGVKLGDIVKFNPLDIIAIYEK